MRLLPSCFVAATLAAAPLVPALAQEPGSCILAGRLADSGWAPRLEGVTLLGANGQVIAAADRQVLAGVRQVRLAGPALLSRCDGGNELAPGEETPGAKSPVPAIGPGVLEVQAVNFPRTRRGSMLVELRVLAPPDRVTTVTR